MTTLAGDQMFDQWWLDKLFSAQLVSGNESRANKVSHETSRAQQANVKIHRLI